MAYSSSVGSAAGTLGSWLFATVCVGASIFYFDEMRALGRHVFGVPSPETVSVAMPNKAVESETREQVASRDGRVELSSDGRGHFITDAQINGRSVEVMVDTGASMVALSYEDAERAGIYVRPSDYTHRANTANGTSKIAPVMIESISIGGITVRDVRGAVAEPGKLSGTLLGMSFLGKLSRAELSRGKLILEE